MLALITQHASAEKNVEIVINPDQALVYYFGFELQRITGIPEQQIEDYGCRYIVSKEKFLKLLSANKAPNDFHYEKMDVRAKVIFSSDTVYYIDRNGTVRSGEQYSAIDKSAFVKILTPLKKGRCR